VSLEPSFRSEVAASLPAGALVETPEELKVYECDALTGHRAQPALVVLPETTEQVQAVVRACLRHSVPFVARGAGTGLSGGATPVVDGIVVSLARMRRILEVDLERRRAVVQPGVSK
jgi:glycolate oxidase